MAQAVPFFRPDLTEREVQEVVDVLHSGWLTTGPRVRAFEERFAEAVGARHAVAVNSCTAALHLAVEALGLRAGQGVLVPTMTFAATAEIVRYMGAHPVLVDCDPVTLHIDLDDAARTLGAIRAGQPVAALPPGLEVVGIIPVHVAGVMMDMDQVQAFARQHGLWVVEDAAHAFPAAWRPRRSAPWQRCGEHTAAVTCFSFYANKTITTGEGGMAVTDDPTIADRIRLMSLHGLSRDAWSRYAGTGQWDYAIEAPGFKYNLTDLAAALGVHQVARAEQMRQVRQQIAARYRARLDGHPQLDVPEWPANRVHAWHLFPLRLRLDQLDLDRAAFLQEMGAAGVKCSVHWRPLHCHPYYARVAGWRHEDLPVASEVWLRLVSLPVFSCMHEEEIDAVLGAVERVCERHRMPKLQVARLTA